MEFYGEKMLPNGLPELIYQVTPDEIREKLKVIVYPKKKERGVQGSCRGNVDGLIIRLYPTVIAFHHRGNGVLSFQYWMKFLQVTLHEIGHLVDHLSDRPWTYKTQYISDRMYKENSAAHAFVEKFAEDWCNQMIEKIASRDPRLGQPTGFIGGLPGIYLLRNKSDYWKFRDNYRAYRAGGQYTLSHLVDDITHHLNIRDHKTQLLIDGKIRRAILKEDFNRIYVDHAGRNHLFFNHGELIYFRNEMNKKIPMIYKNIMTKEFDRRLKELNKVTEEIGQGEIFVTQDLPF
jgi:hypothetical protein